MHVLWFEVLLIDSDADMYTKLYLLWLSKHCDSKLLDTGFTRTSFRWAELSKVLACCCSVVPSGSVKRFPTKRMRSTMTACQRAAPRPSLRGALLCYTRRSSQTAPSPAQATMTHPSQWVAHVVYCVLTPTHFYTSNHVQQLLQDTSSIHR